MAKRTAQIAINGIIGDSLFYRSVSADNIISQIDMYNADNNVSDIDCVIDSPGGDVGEAVKIFNKIFNNPKPINTIYNSTAYSAAFWLGQAGVKRKMMANGMGMSHAAISSLYGNAQDHQNEAAALNKFDNVIAECMSSRINLTVDEVKAKYMSNSEVFFTAQECMDQGLIDEIIPISNKNKTAVENLNRRNYTEVLNYYQNVAMENKMQEATQNNEQSLLTKIWNKISGETAPKNNVITPDPMKLTNVLNLLNGMDKTKPEVVNAIAEASVYINDEKFSQAEVDAKVAAAITDATTPLNLKVTELETKVTEKETALNVAIAAAAGNINAGEEDANQPGASNKGKTWQEVLEAMPHNKNLGLKFKK